jgi:hypothetical protein
VASDGLFASMSSCTMSTISWQSMPICQRKLTRTLSSNVPEISHQPSTLLLSSWHSWKCHERVGMEQHKGSPSAPFWSVHLICLLSPTMTSWWSKCR